MCGIAGYLEKKSDRARVGSVLLAMLNALGQRGPDSAGVALMRQPAGDGEVCWIRLPDGDDLETASVEALRLVGTVSDVRRHHIAGGMVRIDLVRHVPVRDFCSRVEGRASRLEIVSLGRHLELVKQVGAPGNVEGIIDIPSFRGSHGIGHTRLSTESRVDLSHSQPFWARGVPDLATVHNGHITNYHRLRSIYEQKGVRFFTENDSEVIGVYLADHLARGSSLEQAMASSLRDLDGSFTYLVATPELLGFARDPFALKPLITVETDSYIAIANEEVAIRAALGNGGTAHEPSGNVLRVWRRPAPVPVAAGG
jgi:glutamate synthase domain-containing protein 1